jgi:transcriptional regulator with XRE-family HTH domain
LTAGAVGRKAPGLGDGGKAPMAEPVDGEPLSVQDFLAQRLAQPGETPEWLLALLAEDGKSAAPVIPDVIPKGQRNHTLASFAGSMWRIETGRTRTPKLKTRRRLAAVLKVSESELFLKYP